MGAYITWKDAFSVGDASIDAQHKQIISIINDMYAAMESGREYAQLTGLVDRIVKYTMDHFKYEEEVMKACSYPDLENHKVLHEQMRRTTEGFRENIKLVTGRDVVRLLKNWWVSHIQSEDQCYVPYLSVASRKKPSTGAPTQPVSPMNRGGQTPTYH